ncbi:WD40 repeat-like protein [Leucogyrophana mollusca]|uniref:WD40 repeat-like protein n=1 Tax=Leucogyrophana mollusca TaxID=85980 RepID=A0ACB8AYX1_9AGAM|nr:WD40 repeat-like protein [Leucogyrophana mollusca]
MAEVHPYANFARTSLSSAYKVVQKQIWMDQSIVNLMTAMETLYSFMSVADNFIDGKLNILQQNIKTILLQTVECATLISDYAHQGFAGDTCRVFRIKDYAGTCKRLIQGLHDLQANFETGIGAQPVFVSYRTHGVVAETSTHQILDRLMPADMYGSVHSECLPGTCQELLGRIISWATDINSQQNVFWLHGVAGSGKSTVATTVAKYIGEMHRLGAFICFNQSFADCSHPSMVIRTLAHKLGTFDKQIGKAISEAMEGYPGVKDASLSTQFTELLVKPLSSLASLQDKGAIVVVLDALDECGSDKTRAGLLQVLKTKLHQIPSYVRIFITSHSFLNDIRGALEHQRVHKECLYANDADISAFIHKEMTRAKEMDRNLPSDWPGDERIDKLTSCASVKFIREYAPTRRLETVLWSAQDFVTDFHDVLSIILAAKKPLTTSAIDKLLSVSQIQGSAHIVSCLSSVLSYDLDNPAVPVHILHPPFADFLSDTKQSGQDAWYIDKDTSHKDLAIACLKRLYTKGLKKNICNLSLACQDWKSKDLPEDIAYACIFWVDHVSATADSSIALIVPYIEKFLQEHLLHWFEAMSILRKSQETIRLLECLWRQIPEKSYQNLHTFVLDVWRFAQQFVADMEEHPLLIYHDALPFSCKDSLVYKGFYNHELYARVIGLKVMRHMDWVESVAFSPDGTCVVSGSDDKTIQVWNVPTGTQVLPPMQGHQDWMTTPSMCGMPTQAPKSSHQLKGIRTGCNQLHFHLMAPVLSLGTQVLPLIQGHKGWVLSVVFSPDGTHIVSGSDDKTIQVWDTSTGTQVLPPMQGHQGAVLSVAFSPDGTHIVSGSDDKTIRVWDASTGTQVLPPMQGHQGAVLSVAFSPDGTHIVSGSYDNTVCLWDAFMGTQVLPPMQEHQDHVQWVVFSPDGTHILSHDVGDIWLMWDAETGLLSTSYHISNFPSFSTVVKGQWIVDQPKNKTLGKIPPHIRCLASASWGTSLAIGCDNGKVIIMDFPPLLCASSETTGVIASGVRDQNDGAFISEEESFKPVLEEKNSMF